MLRAPYRKCPACGERLEEAGSIERCAGCSGAWVREGVVEEMVREMHDYPRLERLPLEEIEAEERAKTCPLCNAEMAHVRLEGVVLDRCRGHGLWFDPNELQQALWASGENQPEPQESMSNARAFFGLLARALTRRGILLE